MAIWLSPAVTCSLSWTRPTPEPKQKIILKPSRLLMPADASNSERTVASRDQSTMTAGPGLMQPQLTAQPGDRFGPYKILEEIGQGGCGAVFIAEQEQPVRRRVALKVIKLGMDT